MKEWQPIEQDEARVSPKEKSPRFIDLRVANFPERARRESPNLKL